MFLSTLRHRDKEPGTFVRFEDTFDSFFDNFSKTIRSSLPKVLEDWPSATDSSMFVPQIDVKEGEKDFKVFAELPGLDDKDVHVKFDKGRLIIEGEKKFEKKEDNKDKYYVERHYGKFYRAIGLPDNVDRDEADAIFKKGVLEITLPKVEEPEEESKNLHIKTVK